MDFPRRHLLALLGTAPLGVLMGAAAGPNTLLMPARTSTMRQTIERAVRSGRLSGAVWWIERRGANASGQAGYRARTPAAEAITADTLYDIASLTKVVATAPALMILHDQGRVDLEARVCQYLTEFKGEGREFITVRQLLTHTSGLKPGIPLNPPWTGYDRGIELATTTEPFHLPDAQFRYSDINYILLGELVRRVTGETLSSFTTKHLYTPLKMHDTGFTPPEAWRSRIAPTEKDETGTLLRGRVHDPTSRRMGGVTGHAGLFSTAGDLARFARMILQEGTLDGVRVIRAETVGRMISVQTPPALPDQRGLGWDINTGYSRPRGSLFPLTSFGHTGFTGTCMWLDPGSGTFYVFLTSRLHGTKGPTRVLELYSELGTLAAQAAGYAVAAGGAGL